MILKTAAAITLTSASALWALTSDKAYNVDDGYLYVAYILDVVMVFYWTWAHRFVSRMISP